MHSDPQPQPGLGAVASAIDAEASALQDKLVEIRRDLHHNAEVSREEFRTTRRLRSLLEGLGLEPQSFRVPTGCYVDIVPGDWSGELVALRGDIDALPLDDPKQVSYASKNAGATHACGHDVHTTVLLGTAAVLTRLRRAGLLRRGARLLFQPAEESSPGGAADMIAAGALEGVREAYALHCDPATTVGEVAVSTGPITSACDQFDIRFSGPGGHTSRPHLSADLIGAIGAVITQLPFLLTRRVDPRGGVSLMWGRVRAGNAPNAIPADGELACTLRCLDLDAWRVARELVPRLVAEIVSPYGVQVDVRRSVNGIPPTVNHPAGAARVVSVVTEMLGSGAVAETAQSLGGEDFGEILQVVPGAMGRLGVRPRGKAAAGDLHRPEFDVDEECLGVGVRVMAGLVAL
ncbi:M20 family metallopeptidase [Mariniluteicoccus endophyticus]